MGDGFEQIKIQMKKILKKAGKSIRRLGLPIIALVLIAIIVVGGLGYEMTRQDGSFVEGDESNVLYEVRKFTQDVTIEKDGTIRTAISAQELWDEMVKNHTRIDEYLDNPQQLLKLMNAEIVTNYPDTRPEGEIDKPLDKEFWDNLSKNVDSTETQGIIKFKRAREDGTTQTMTYVDSDTFYKWIELYLATGDESARENALTHFTIQENPTVTNKTDLNYNGIDVLTDISERIVAAAKVTPWPGPGLCQAWVRAVYRNAGLGDVAYPTAVAAFDANVVSTSMDNIPIGAAVYGTGSGAYNAGHVGIYIGNGMVMDSVNSGIQTSSLEDWVAWQVQAGATHNGVNGWLGWGWQAGQPSKILSEGGSSTDDKSTNSLDSDDSTSGGSQKTDVTEMEQITDNGKITFYNGDGSAMEGGKLNALGYELEEGQVAMKDLNKYKNSVIYIQTSDSGEGSYANGKFFYVTDTGGGLADNQVDVYANVDQSKLNAAPYGSFGSGAKIYLVEENVSYDDYKSNYLNKTSEPDEGSGLTGQASKYNVVVAKWGERYEEVVAGGDGSVDPDPVIPYKEGQTTYTLTDQKIDYQSMVSGYQMPFDYLWQWIVTGRDKDFGLDIADLIYGSEIEITIHDNVTKVTDVDTYDYTRKTKYHTHDIVVTGSWSDTTTTTDSTGATTSTPSSGSIHEGPLDGGEKEDSKHYVIIHTTITTTDTLDVSLTKANVWIVDYTQDFEYQQENNPTVTGDPAAMEQNREYPGTPDKSDNADPAGLGAAVEQNVRAKYSDKDHVTTSMTCTTDYYYGFNGTVTNQNTVETKKYTALPKEIKPKDDPHAEEDNFVTILKERDHHDTLTNVMSAPDWLFDLIEENERTVDMLDLTKYLLYRASGVDYGVTDFDFSIFDPANFMTVGGAYGSSGIGGIQGQIYDFFLGKGIPPEGVAAIMGNIEGESSFNTAASNGTHFGLFQWGGGRFDSLKSYASSQGKDWTDLNCQLEYAWQELNGAYSNVKDVLMNTTQESQIEYATWYFGRYFEVFFTGDSFEATKSYTQKRYEYALKWYKEWQENHTAAGGDFLAVAKQCHDYLRTNNFVYHQGNNIPLNQNGNNYVDCSSYVTWVLYEYGYKDLAGHQQSTRTLLGLAQRKGWTIKSGSEAVAGDIVLIPSYHTAIYAGNGQFYDCGSTNLIRSEITTWNPGYDYAITVTKP